MRPWNVALALLLLAPAALAQGPATRPIAVVDHVLIISVDGLRPDLIARAKAEHISSLMDSGAFSLWALTIPSCNTLPSHVSMLTGVTMEKHGIEFNDERSTTRPIYTTATTIFELAKRAGYTTALVSGKSKFQALAKPGSIDWLSAPELPKTSDDIVADNAGTLIRLFKPGLMFVHFPGADSAGHSKGWGSREQIDTIANIDRNIGMLMNALKTSGMAERTVVILSADHGGSGRSHGASIANSRTIPWIVCGPGIRVNHDLTLSKDLTINTMDTFATACWLLGIELPEGIDGKPIKAILPPGELLQPAPTSAPASAPAR